MPTPDTSSSVDRVEVADGVELHVRRWHGIGVPFLLVHGLASNARLWDGVAAELADAGHDVVAVDLRGHGRSSKPADGYEMATVGDDLRVLIERVGLDRPVAVGQSWGGNVVVELAARHPGLLRAVGCVDGGGIELSARFPDWEACADALRPPPVAGMKADDFEAMVRRAHPDWPESGIRGVLANVERCGDGTVAPWLSLDRHLDVLRGLWAHHPCERLRDIREPVLFLGAGPVDDPTGHELAAAAAAAPRGRLEWIDGDHDLHAQHPRQVAGLLRTLAGPGRTEEGERR